MLVFTLTFIFFLSFVGIVQAAIPPEWGEVTLVQKIQCSDAISDPELFTQFPAGASKVETLCGRPCRVLSPNEKSPQYMAWKVGKGLNLQPGKAYILCVEFPEDASRAFFIHNGGNETINGVSTGATVGDALMGRYVNTNPESLSLPLSGRLET